MPKSAFEIINGYQAEAPVDVVGIANDLGVNVYESATMGEGVAGRLFRDDELGGESGWVIFAKKQDFLPRKRFTVAHEIAHFILHRTNIGEELNDDEFYRSKLSSRKETEANQLAAEILMPYSLLDSLVESGLNKLSALAEKLEVSKQALKIRLGFPA